MRLIPVFHVASFTTEQFTHQTNHSGTALSNGLGGSDIIMHRILGSLCQQSFYQWFIVYFFERMLIYLFLLLDDYY